MDNIFLPSSTNSTNTTSPSNPNMGWSQDSHFAPIYVSWSYPSIPPNTSTQSYCYPAVQYNIPPPPTSPFQSLQVPYTYTQVQASGQYPSVAYPLYPFSFRQNEIGMQGSYFLQPNVLSIDQERRNLDADRTKAARCKRKEARQRSLSRAASSSGPSSTQEHTERQVLTGASTHVQNNSTVRINKDLYNFLTPDNKRLRMLLSKVLKKSDVGALGRIVLPKRETEENLPPLNDKEGIQIKIRDAFSELSWKMKFKFWTNNNSRMYVLENTGDFVKEYRMKSGDSLILYEDESKNLYFTIRKAEISLDELTDRQNQNYNNSYLYLSQNQNQNQARGEEDALLELPLQQLTNQEQRLQEPLPMDASSSYVFDKEASNHLFNNFPSTSSLPRTQLDPFNNITTISSQPQPGSLNNLPQPATAAMHPSSSSQGIMRVADNHHMDNWFADLDGMFSDFYSDNFSL